MNYRDLEAVRQIILDSTGLEVAYAYDDLVFPEETLFIIQFDEEDVNHLLCYFHEDFEGQARNNVFMALDKGCANKDVKISSVGTYSLKANEENGETTDIVFNLSES